MPRPGLADQQELLRWADSIGSRSELPRLVRKLILETGKGVVQLGFPAGEGIAAGSWDGSARATESSPFVPDGLSLWELSVEKSVGTKATSDYSKRSSTPDGTPTSDCTYIAVSLRRWQKRGEWAKEKVKDKRWREVRAYGVDDVETWLESAPVTHAWLSEHLGLAPHGLRAGDSWWNGWSQATAPELTPDLVLAGRGSAADALRSRLNGPPSLTTIKAGSLEEGLAFVSAVAVQAGDRDEDRILARLAFVDDVASWRALQDHKQPLVLVPVTPEVLNEVGGTSNHQVVVPIATAATADLELVPIDAGEAKDALQAAGLDDERRADRAGRLGRRSLLALRRRLATKPELHTPVWARPPGNRTIRGALLAGRWNARSSGDLEVMSDLIGKSGDDLRDALDALAADEDPLVAKVDQSWALVSPYDAWLQLRSQLEEADLKRFEGAVRAVLLEVDPALDLPEENRWRAAVEGKVRKFSGDLRIGLTTSLALLGVNGEKVDEGRGEAFASYLVRILLEEANGDATGRIWSSLSYHLPQLAEAAPDSLVNGVRDGLKGDPPVLAQLFADPKGQSSLFSADSPHTGLLWALEGLAWSDDHFGQVIDLLARLAEIDPGGQLTNRPANSLKEIFCPWYPENAASKSERLAAIDALRRRHPEIAWELMLAMLPDFHGIHSPTHEPEFRDWKPPHEPVTNIERFELEKAITERLVADAGKSGDRWSALIEDGSNVSPLWELVREGLKKQVGSLDSAEQTKVWKSLRAFIGRHREYSDANWALPAQELEELEAVAEHIAPDDSTETHEWLFEEHMPDLGEGGKRDYAKYQDALGTRRRQAVEAIDSESGLKGLLATAKKSPVPGAVGWALADASAGKYDDKILDLIESEGAAEQTFAMNYFARRFRQEGWDWLEKLLDSKELSPTAQGRLLVRTDDYPKAWEVADERGDEVTSGFWHEFVPLGLGQDYPHLKLTAEKLLEAGRPAAALHLVEMYLRDESDERAELAEVMANALDVLLKTQDEDPEFQSLRQYDFQRALAHLEEHVTTLGSERVARLEWAYLPALGYEPHVPTLHAELAANPSFFVQILSAVYRPKSQKSEPKSDPDKARVAENGYRLLSSWTTLPGTDEGGKVDPKKLKAWVDTAIDELREADRLEVGEVQIGHVLAHAPADPNGDWPCEAVREILEILQSKRVEEGFSIEVFNSRGVTSRSPEAGGDQERALAEKYRESATKFASRWPRIAGVLRDLAKTYEHDAKRFDTEAERRRRGLDP